MGQKGYVERHTFPIRLNLRPIKGDQPEDTPLRESRLAGGKMTDDDRKTLHTLKGEVAHMQQVVVGTEQIVREATGELRQIKDMLCDARPLVQRFGRLEAFMMLMAVSAVIVAGCAAIVAFQVIVG